MLADHLETTSQKETEQIKRTISALRWCSSMSYLEKTEWGTGQIIRTSKKCRNHYCSICARARSTRLASRLQKAMQDRENDHLFKDKKFYFLTLTVKHNETTRNGIYLKEFNSYCNRLFRSKIWKSYFPRNSKPGESGWIQCRECTLSKASFHIHAHILICAPRLTTKITAVEKSIREKWVKITGDSDQIRLDLIGKTKQIKSMAAAPDQKSEVQRAAKELFKYGTKAGRLDTYDVEKAERLATWINSTKGANFVNCSGLFRGLQLTGCKSKYDAPLSEFEPNKKSNYYITKTSKILFNYPTWKNYSRKKRKDILGKCQMKMTAAASRDVTSFAKEAMQYMTCGLEDDQQHNIFEHSLPADQQRRSNELQQEQIRLLEKEKAEQKKREAAAQLRLYETGNFVGNQF